MTPKIKPPKATRAAIIEKCLRIIAAHCGADPSEVLLTHQPQKKLTKRSRALLWHHMHHCGMSCGEIGRVFHRISSDRVKIVMRRDINPLTDSDLDMFSALPKIPNSLDIEFVSGNPEN